MASDPIALSAPLRTTPSTPARVLGALGGVALGAVLLVAAWAKSIDPAAFAEQIRLEGLALVLSPTAMALAVIALEVGLGLSLVLGLRRLPVLVPTAALVALFLFLTGRTWWRAVHGTLDPALASCGCFGNLVERSPAEAFLQDLLLMVPALVLAFVARPRGPWPRLRTALVVAGTVGATLFAWRAPALPLDDLATRLRPGVAVSGICAGQGETRICLDSIAPDLAQGTHLVVLVDLDVEPDVWVAQLGAISTAHPEVPVVALAAVDSDRVRAFFWQHGPAFEVREAPAQLMRPLYRRLPRAFRVEDGRVTATWPGLPPQESPAPAAR